ncbi:MAG: hypothetical protein ACYDEP_05385 [Acidimicrobiales bacterium]
MVAVTWSALGLLAVISVSFLGFTWGQMSNVTARIDETNTRIDKLGSDMNARLDQMNARIDQQGAEIRAEIAELRTIVISTNGRLDTLIERVANLETHRV